MFRKFITVNADGVVQGVVQAEVVAGFLEAPRDDIQPGDVLTDDEKIAIGLMQAPEGYVAPDATEVRPPVPSNGEVITGELVEPPASS